MTKISNIILFLLGGISLNLEGMNRKPFTAYKTEHVRPIRLSEENLITNSFIDKLREAIDKEDFNSVKNIINSIKKSKLDLNKISLMHRPLFYYIVSDFVINPSDFKLKAIEYLIQNGIDLNNTYFTSSINNHTPLESIIDYINNPHMSFDQTKAIFYFKYIALLLGYGENITDKTIEVAQKDRYRDELVKIFDHHTNIINQAKINPTANLLLEAIGYNKPYIVKLIVDNKPELVTIEDLKLAEKTSPYSAKTLKQILLKPAIQKFEESELVQTELPLELVEQVKKFILH